MKNVCLYVCVQRGSYMCIYLYIIVCCKLRYIYNSICIIFVMCEWLYVSWCCGARYVLCIIFFNHTGYFIFVYPTVRSLSSGTEKYIALHYTYWMYYIFTYIYIYNIYRRRELKRERAWLNNTIIILMILHLNIYIYI